MTKLSAVIITKNEEKNIRDCLESLRWADEIIVVDDHSTDKTLEIAKEYTDKIYLRALSGNFAAQRNFALNRVSHDWIMFIDADERISTALKEEIKEAIAGTNYQGFYLKRDDINFGHHFRFGETAAVKFIRLARKGTGVWKRRVHEYWEVTGRVGELKNHLLHYSHTTIPEFVQKINKFSSLSALVFFEEGRKEPRCYIFVFPICKFVQNIIFRQGFRDGVYGFIFAALMSFHSFLTRVKLLQLWRSQDENRN